MPSPRRIYLTNAAVSTALTLVFYHGWLWWIFAQHGMPVPGISENNVVITLAAVLCISAIYPLMMNFLYRRADRQQRMAAIAATIGNMMSVCFAATGTMGQFGHNIFLFGFIIGIGGAFAALRAGLEKAVGGAVLLVPLFLQVILITTLIP